MFKVTLRTQFLFALALISTLITSAVLLVVRYRVQLRVNEELTTALDTSVHAFGRLQQQREQTLERSAALLAALPPLKALMTSSDPLTIQDASETFWRLAGSQVFVLATREGLVSAFHASTPGFPREAAQAAIDRFVATGAMRDWWFGGGHLFQVFLQPISVGSGDDGYPIGLLAVGYEVDGGVARDVGRLADGEVAFAYGGSLVVATVGEPMRSDVAALVAQPTDAVGNPRQTTVGRDPFLASTVRLSDGGGPPVTLTVLKSYDEGARFLRGLNRWIVGIGIAGVLAGAALVFLVSTTFTRPLARLASGVRALEQGNYEFPLDEQGSEEVSVLTAAFNRMRHQLQATQRQLIESERLALIGRMANTISHDLRHPLTAIQAYAEFLAEGDLTEAQRRDFFQEIRIAVNHMTDEINALLGFSHQRQALQTAIGRLDEVIERAIRTVKALPEFEGVAITCHAGGECTASFDPGKFERVMLNLLFNAAEAVPPVGGRIEIRCRTTPDSVELRVGDNGPGIPQAIVDTLFQPFVSHGKQKGTGLGLAVVQNVMQQHGGTVVVERTGPEGTTFLLRFPRTMDDQMPQPAA
ncbi:MAG: PAS domain-containing sensor histidine kinase [Vicinamibacterales bacterium]